MNSNPDPIGTDGAAPYGAEDVEAWLRTAQPGAQLCYHSGMHATEAGAALNARLQAEAARGMVYLVQRRRRSRDPDGAPAFGFDYLAIRSSRPWAPGSDRPRRRPTDWAEELRTGIRTAGERVFA